MKKTVWTAAWLLTLALCLLLLNQLMGRRDGRERYAPLFQQAGEYDAFFLGTSHVMNGILPNELWRDYGITAYNLGNTAEPMDTTYWTLRLAMERHVPRIAVIDVAYIDRVQAGAGSTAFAHGFLDEVPLSAEKLRAIRALFPERQRAEFVFPLVLYHTRWEELLGGGVQANNEAVSCMFGAELRVGRSEPAPFVRTQEMAAEPAAGEEALRAIIALCRERGVEPVLTAIPFPAETGQQQRMNRARLISQELDVPFVDLFDVPGLVDFETDCYDPASHLNPDGASKVTAYLGAWLAERYAIEDKRQDERFALWDEALAEYERIRASQWGAQSLLHAP
ncbi:MAG: hypothetical protein ACI4PG_13135 [Candidatus Ventricola sp.]